MMFGENTDGSALLFQIKSLISPWTSYHRLPGQNVMLNFKVKAVVKVNRLA